MKKILLIYGHGGTDPGAGANGINERDFFRLTLHPHLVKWANLSEKMIEFYTGNAYQSRHLDKVDPKTYDVLELHLDGSSSANSTGGHVIIHADYTPDEQDKRLGALIQRLFGCRGGVCFSGRRDLQNVNIARHRSINYRLAELCFVTNANDVKKLLASVDEVAKGIIEAMTGETLKDPIKPQPKPTPPADDWTTRVRKDLTNAKVMSDGGWDKAVTKDQVASWLYTAKAKGYFK